PMSAPRTTPVIPQVDVQHTGQRRSGYPAAKPYLPITDSSERLMIPELSIRHDSLATPAEVLPQKLISDSMSVKKIDIQRDTANRHKKPATKKRRRLSVFS
ncbi:MAG: hypothetical protein JST19_21005, partial [Bacteroidetes bacterium]|nr:hypothetical protein [Bacteroidota bacterium]